MIDLWNKIHSFSTVHPMVVPKLGFTLIAFPVKEYVHTYTGTDPSSPEMKKSKLLQYQAKTGKTGTRLESIWYNLYILIPVLIVQQKTVGHIPVTIFKYTQF